MPRTDNQPASPARRRLRQWLVLLCLAAAAGLFSWWEARTSRVEAWLAARIARKLTYRLEPGPTDSVVYPVTGPYDIRRGYVNLPEFADSLLSRGFEVTSQARFSPWMHRLAESGLYPVYREKTRAGLTLFDQAGGVMYAAAFPERVYADFDSIPPLIVQTLLFIENRELLNADRPYMNPAVEWDRFFKAAAEQILHVILRTADTPGGSTLATQIEKYRHSEEGRTSSPMDKLRQMTSATLRAYLDGEKTTQVRREIVLEFINSVPLAALAGYGEVNGLGDGLWAWYNADFDRVNRLLAPLQPGPGAAAQPGPAAVNGSFMPLEQQALAYKQVLSLFIAHRRPSTYLITGREVLRRETDSYLRLMAARGIIPPELRDAALATPLAFRTTPPVAGRNSFVQRKAANALRTRLLNLTNVYNLYELDRLDLTVKSTLDTDAQRAVTALLERLKNPAFADSAGLRGERLLKSGDPAGIIYSFTLYQRTPTGNLLRVQADNYDQPLDINEGAKLDLGSTAKLRTLVTYLEIITDLHRRYAGRPRAEIRRVAVDRGDKIRGWAIDYLSNAADTSLAAMLEGAMNRSYSASPGEKFFTAGGLHAFVNFNKDDNGRVLTVRDGIRNSVNLVFIRLMRDIERYFMSDLPDYTSDLFENPKAPLRQEYLSRFADKEGREFLARFYTKYREKSPAQCLARIVEGIHPTPKRLAVIFRSVRPEASEAEFAAYLARQLPGPPPPERVVHDLYQSYSRDAYDLADRGYIARVHPLELWLVEYLYQHPGAGWREVVRESAEERQIVYKWLFKTRYMEAQNKRIGILLEVEAFEKIHESWARQGYPFSSLVPSYATSIGSSADRPAALAELMGIIVNDGVRYPSERIESLHFAAGTPYEVLIDRKPARGERVYPRELAQVVRAAVTDVVENGTAKRAYHAFKRPDGSFVTVGGKTGTGDQRYETFGRGGVLIESRVVNRTATFVFLIGDSYFGTLTAYVHGPPAAGYGFTSSLPVQLLKILAPALQPLVAGGEAQAVTAAGAEPEPAAHTAREAGAGPAAGPIAVENQR